MEINVRVLEMATIRRSRTTFKADFARAIDGDTIDVWLRVSHSVKVLTRLRLQGIDSWELDGADRAAALETASWVNALLDGTTLTVECIEGNCDRYGRTLATATLNREDLGQLLIREGLAWPFGREDKIKHAARQTRLAALATKAAVGLVLVPCVALIACHAPCIQTGGSAYVVEAAPPPLSPTALTNAAALDSATPRAPTTAESQVTHTVISHGGPVTLTGSRSPVHAEATTETATQQAYWRTATLWALAGAAAAIIIIIATKLGWKLVINAAKSAI